MNPKLNSLLALAALLETPEQASPLSTGPSGQHIAVLDRGFVYVGDIATEGDFMRIRNAKNIRKWGTTKGLGELRNGPLANTVTDEVGEVLVPLKALIHLIPSKGF